MEEYLYRYIGFDTFVDMIQSKALTFVLPTVWEDPQELHAIKVLAMKDNDAVKNMFIMGIMDKTYAQCWSTLCESDAMWRIYSHEKKALRIKVKREDFKLVDSNVQIQNVIYTDQVEEEIKSLDTKRDFYKLWTYKRKAFEHEKEVRIILPYRYPDEDTVIDHINAYTAFYAKETGKRVKAIESFKKGSIKENFDYAVSLTNANGKIATKKVSYKKCPSFIRGVLVHPMAPQWYVETVCTFCEINNIPFEGKSSLYQR